MPDPAAVNSMFGRIAHRYDLANRVLSGGIDLYWRARLVSAVRRSHPRDILDLATGSGDVALALARGLPKGTRIVGMDFCEPMLVEAEAKKARLPGSTVEFIQGDALALPLTDEGFDAVTIAFGLRNMADRARCLLEMHRVLRPQGRLFVLEFSQPQPWFRPLYSFHMRTIAPHLAGFLTGDKAAYDYLRESIGTFPARDALSKEIVDAGFSSVSGSAMTFGVVALHVAQR
jgi:demethylmenaquinone methyltransferase/2-methoxy-6-polyprenyl-1,4-benzoquinol methylase